MIPGSGPTDQNGNNSLGVKASTYRLIAEGLAAQGIASLRIDKRGMYSSAAAAPNPNAVTIADYASDVRTWVAEVRKLTGTACVWLLGHSEGGLVALAAAQTEPGICGLLLVSVAGRPLGEVLRTQLRSNPANAPVLDEALAAVAALEAGRRVDGSTLHPALRALFRPEVQDFLMDALSYDPAQLISAVSRPVLILQGLSDLQVGEDDARRLAKAQPEAELVLLPGINHVLKAVKGDDRASNLAAYADPNLPLAPGIIDTLSTFIARDSSERIAK
jgi:alpha-beta hydrolase superfamily lysophospholipase